MNKKVKIDPAKVIKVEPKMIKTDFTDTMITKLIKKNMVKSKIKLPQYDELNVCDIHLIHQYVEGLNNYLKNFIHD